MIKQIIKNIEETVGLKIEDIYQKSPVEIREFIENTNKQPTKFISEFPFIGRGNVLRDGIVDNMTLNNEIDAILGIK